MPTRRTPPGEATGGFCGLGEESASVVVYTGTSKLETRLDQTGAKGYAVGFQGLIRCSGIDRVVQMAELYQLPAPDFRVSHQRTLVVIYGPRGFDAMDREDRVRACYQHCALKWVMSEGMTNQSLRERFHLPESNSAIVSQVISAATEAGLVKADERVGGSRKFARYLPFWA